MASTVMGKDLDRLVTTSLLRPRIDGGEWLVPGLVPRPMYKEGYVVSFIPFHERGVAVLEHVFLRVLLFFYGCQLHHLNPNGIQQLATFVVLCKGFLGVPANFARWKHFFCAKVMRCRVGSGSGALSYPSDIGSVLIQLRASRKGQYIDSPAPSGHSGWHRRWFHRRNDSQGPLPVFTNLQIGESWPCWEYGTGKDERRGLDEAIEVIRVLKERGFNSSGVIGFYHQRRFLPLMARDLPIWRVTPAECRPLRIVMAMGLLPDVDIEERVKAAVGPGHTPWPIAGCPGGPSPGA